MQNKNLLNEKRTYVQCKKGKNLKISLMECHFAYVSDEKPPSPTGVY